MQRDERFFSRGNAAIAALALVAAIGIGALALDSTMQQLVVVQSAKTQLAAAAMPTDKGICVQSGDGWICEKDDSQNRKCAMGEDYIVKLQEGIDPVTKSKTKIGIVYLTDNGSSTNTSNQCTGRPNTVTFPGTPPQSFAKVETKVYNGFRIPERLCKATKGAPGVPWYCTVTFCGPSGFGNTDALNKEVCRTVPKFVEIDSSINAKQAASESGFSKTVQDGVDKGTPQEKAEAIKYAPALPDETSKPLVNAFDTERRDALNNLDTAQKNADRLAEEQARLEKLAEDCDARDCPQVQQQLKANQEALAKQQADMQKFAADVKALGVPTVPDPSKCVNDVTCGAADPNREQNDDRFKPANTFNPGPTGAGGGGGLSKLLSPNALGSLMDFAKSALGLAGVGAHAPKCTLTVTPKNITQPGQSVTLSWTTQGAQSAYLSNVGQVGPSGSMQVQPQQATTYTMQVQGVQQTSQQQQNPYGAQQQDSFCVTSINPTTIVQGSAVPGCFNYRPQGSSYSPYGTQQSGTPTYGNCSAQVTLGADPDAPVAQISCQPKIAEVGTKIALSFACQNATASSGNGFSTANALSGTTTATTTAPTLGSDSIVYGLTCSKEGRTHSAQCTVQVVKSAIVLVANPKKVQSGETTNIGWITAGIDSCKVWSPTLGDEWPEGDMGSANTSGTIKSPAITKNTEFHITCATKTGLSKTASTTVMIE